jgi:crotonobetainyl-CoA:carnitine CoA-transferase CaiB-like acyl-CoA transferase
MSSRPTSARALSGIRVLDLTRLLPGPFLALALSDLGADVVKVEDPRLGDYMRPMPPAKGGVSGRFHAVNRDKRSMTLDLKSPAGRDAFLRLAERADVVLESFRPGVMERLGVGYPVLAERNPRLVLASISGYGQDGPYRERAGHDLNYIGLAGLLAMSGPRGGAPQMPGVPVADFAGGGLWGAIGVLGALVGRERTGRGAWVDDARTEGALALCASDLGDLDAGAHPTRGAQALNGGLACYGVYATKDGKYLSVGALEPKFWVAFNQAIGRAPDMSELVLPPEGQERVRAEVQAILSTRTRAEWEAVFAATDACCEPILELDELATHPQHQARGVFFHVEHPRAGATLQVRTPVGRADAERPAPALGQHTDEVLAEYGFSAEDVASLRSAGALG